MFGLFLGKGKRGEGTPENESVKDNVNAVKPKKHIATLGMTCIKKHAHYSNEAAFDCNNKTFGIGNWIYECDCGETTHYHDGFNEVNLCAEIFKKGGKINPVDIAKARSLDEEQAKEAKDIAKEDTVPTKCARKHEHSCKAEADECDRYHADPYNSADFKSKNWTNGNMKRLPLEGAARHREKHVATLGRQCLQMHDHKSEEDALRCNNNLLGVGNWIYGCNLNKESHHHRGIDEARRCRQTFHDGMTRFDLNANMKKNLGRFGKKCLKGHDHCTEDEAFQCNNKTFGVGNWIYKCKVGGELHYHRNITAARFCAEAYQTGFTEDENKRKMAQNGYSGERTKIPRCAFDHEHATAAEAKACNEHNAKLREAQRKKAEYLAKKGVEPRVALAQEAKEWMQQRSHAPDSNGQENSYSNGPIITEVESDEESI